MAVKHPAKEEAGRSALSFLLLKALSSGGLKSDAVLEEKEVGTGILVVQVGVGDVP